MNLELDNLALETDARIGERVLSRVYDFLGFDLTPEVEQTFMDYQERNATGARGAHNYTPEQFGLTKAQLRSDYAFYIERFDIRIDD